MAQRPVNIAMNYYRARRTIGAAAAVNVGFFKNQGSLGTRELNSLGDGGFLPDDRSGMLTGLMVKVGAADWPGDANTDRALATVNDMLADFLMALEELEITLWINTSQVIKGPIWCFPHPPHWLQGFSSETTQAAQGAVATLQNGGYQLPFVQQEIPPRSTIEARVTGTLEHAPERTALSVEVVLQVSDARPL